MRPELGLGSVLCCPNTGKLATAVPKPINTPRLAQVPLPHRCAQWAKHAPHTPLESGIPSFGTPLHLTPPPWGASRCRKRSRHEEHSSLLRRCAEVLKHALHLCGATSLWKQPRPHRERIELRSPGKVLEWRSSDRFRQRCPSLPCSTLSFSGTQRQLAGSHSNGKYPPLRWLCPPLQDLWEATSPTPNAAMCGVYRTM